MTSEQANEIPGFLYRAEDVAALPPQRAARLAVTRHGENADAR